MTRDAVIGVCSNGYYPCVVVVAIDRVLGLNLGRHSIPEPEDPLAEELRVFCLWCGFIRMNITADVFGAEALVSPSWERAYAEWNRRKPELPLFPLLR